MVLANIGSHMVLPLMALYVASLGASVGQVGLFFTLASIFPLLFQILGGWVSDTLGRIRAISLGSLGGMLSYVFLFLAPTFWWLLLSECLASIARSLVGPSFSAFTAEEAEEGKRGRTFGATQTIFLIVAVIGPALGGVVADRFGFRAVILVAGLLYLSATLIRLGMARKVAARGQPSERPDLAGLRRQMAGMLALMVAGGVMTWIVLIDGVRDISFRLSFELMPVYLEQLRGISVTQIGLLGSIVGVGSMLLTPISGLIVDRRDERTAIALGTISVTAGFALFLGARSFGAFALAWALFGASWGLMDPAYQALISRAVPPKMLGTAFGFLGTSIGLFSLPAPWLGGLLWTRVAPDTPFTLTMLIAGVSIVPIWLKFRLAKGAPGEPQASSLAPQVATEDS
jgi:MFS family permease